MKDHQRPVWIIVFAILLASIAIRVNAQDLPEPLPATLPAPSLPAPSLLPVPSPLPAARLSPAQSAGQVSKSTDSSVGGEASGTRTGGALTTEIDTQRYSKVEFNGKIYMIEKPARATATRPAASSMKRSGASDGRHSDRKHSGRRPLGNRLRPKYAVLDAELANFDADEDPDGWIAHVALFDSSDRPAGGQGGVHGSRATFELVQRVPTQDFTGYVTADAPPVTWSLKLNFDETGFAKVRLPLRQTIDPVYGWSSGSDPGVGTVRGLYGSKRRGLVRHTLYRHAGTTVLTNPAQAFIGGHSGVGLPEWGQLRVRVSVPSEGVFSAVRSIRLRPAVLVDTSWPYH